MIRYESCETTKPMPFSDSDLRNVSATDASISGSRHWFGVLVKTWMAVAPISAPRAGAR